MSLGPRDMLLGPGVNEAELTAELRGRNAGDTWEPVGPTYGTDFGESETVRNERY